jgi:hypothetical protein
MVSFFAGRLGFSVKVSVLKGEVAPFLHIKNRTAKEIRCPSLACRVGQSA